MRWKRSPTSRKRTSQLLPAPAHRYGCANGRRVRNAGTHAAGVIITDKPLIEYIPLHRPTGSTVAMTAGKSGHTVRDVSPGVVGAAQGGLPGLATLTIMARACDLICQRHGVELNLDNIPLDDPVTYDLLGGGDRRRVPGGRLGMRRT